MAAATERERVETQGTLFEEDCRRRTVGSVAALREGALTELVATSRGAGATRVEVTIPRRSATCSLSEMMAQGWLLTSSGRRRG